MDIENEVVKLCILGTQAEFAGKPEQARDLYAQAWKAAKDAYEACVAAHYVARFQDEPGEKLRWNLLALEQARAAGQEQVADFYPSLYLNIGQAYELVGEQAEAARYYGLAAELGFEHGG